MVLVIHYCGRHIVVKHIGPDTMIVTQLSSHSSGDTAFVTLTQCSGCQTVGHQMSNCQKSLRFVISCEFFICENMSEAAFTEAIKGNSLLLYFLFIGLG